MSRPIKCRHVSFKPGSTYFKPRAIPLSALEELTLSLDELEALRLADFEGLYHEEAANKMHVSRQTFGNIVKAARKKVADALVNGKAIRIEGGVCNIPKMRTFICDDCSHSWQAAFGTGRPEACPACKSINFCRSHMVSD